MNVRRNLHTNESFELTLERNKREHFQNFDFLLVCDVSNNATESGKKKQHKINKYKHDI